MGFYGIALLIVLMAFLACSMKSFGVPYFSPVAPRTNLDYDTIFKIPVWAEKERPDYLNTLKRKKQGNNVKVWINNDDDSDSKREAET